MLLQDRIGSKPNLVLAGGYLDEVDSLSYLGSCFSPGGRMSEK